MAGGTLNYRIELDAAEAQAALEGLQSAGSDLFRTMEKAASALTAGGGFAALTTAISAAGAAVVGITGSLFAMANASSQTVDELSELAAQTGSSVEEISTLRSALVQLEANGETLASAFQRMGNTIQEMWTEIQKSVDGAASKIVSDQIDVEKATLSLSKAQLDAKGSSTALAQAYLGIEQAAITLAQAQQKVAESTDVAAKNHLDLQQALLSQQQTQQELARFSQEAAQQQINSALGIEGAIQGVADAEIALKQARGETVSAETIRQNTIKRAELALQQAIEQRAQAEERASREQEDLALRRRQLQLQEAQAAQAVADAQKRRAQEAQQAQLVQLQLEQARLAQSEAKKKAADAELDSQGKLLSVHEAELRLSKAREEQRQTEINSIGNLKTAIDGLASGAKGSLGTINASVDNMVKGLIASVGPGVEALQGVSGGLGDISRNAPAMVPVLHKLADVFHNMEDGALKLAIATKLFGRAAARDMLDALKGGSAAIIEQEQRMRSLGLVITNNEAVSDKFIAAQNRLKEVVRIVSVQLGQLFAPAFTAGMDRMAETIARNREGILEWGAAINSVLVPALDNLGVVFGVMAAAAVAAIRLILVSLGPVGIAIVGFGIALGLIIQYWPQIKEAAEPVLKWLSEALAAVNEWWKVIRDAGLAAWTAIRDGAVAAWTAIRETAQPVLDWLTSAWEAIKNAGIAAWDAIKASIDAVLGVVNAVIEAIGSALDKLRTLLFESKDVGTPGGGLSDTGGFAGGGLVGGRGSGTSDSNLAWVSRGEHIMPARAVGQPGVLAFLEALRRSGGNLRRVLDGMGRFALGGPVMMPALAGGGIADAHRNLGVLTLKMPDGTTVTGLTDERIAEALGRAAAQQQIRSGGRKPSRYT